MKVSIVEKKIGTFPCDAILDLREEDWDHTAGAHEASTGESVQTERVSDRPYRVILRVSAGGRSAGERSEIFSEQELRLKKIYYQAVRFAQNMGCGSIALPMAGEGGNGCRTWRSYELMKLACAELSGDISVYAAAPQGRDEQRHRQFHNGVTAYLRDLNRGECVFYDIEEEPFLDSGGPQEVLRPSDGVFCDTVHGMPNSAGWDEDIWSFGDGAPLAGETYLEKKKEKRYRTVDGPDGPIELEETFQQKLLRFIKEKGMTEAECYNNAGISRQVFSKIRNNVEYIPSRMTAVSFALALELDLEETTELLNAAGLALSHSILFDVIIEHCIKTKQYDFYDINLELSEHSQKLLGVDF